jgi:hypothetical protein
MHVKLLRRTSVLFVEMTGSSRIVAAVFLAAMMLATTLLVYGTGGIRFPYSP